MWLKLSEQEKGEACYAIALAPRKYFQLHTILTTIMSGYYNEIILSNARYFCGTLQKG